MRITFRLDIRDMSNGESHLKMQCSVLNLEGFDTVVFSNIVSVVVVYFERRVNGEE